MRKSALVTGSSTGIGAATALRLARDGWDVGVHYHRDRDGAEATAEAVRAAGGTAHVFQADMAHPEQIAPLFEAFDRAFGQLDALVNNAGIVDQVARVDEMSADRLTRMFAVNLTAPILCAGEAVRRMSTSKGGAGGVIVNVSSASAKLGSPGQYVDYAASKGGIDTFTKGLALEVAAEGIRVAGVRPGIVETGIHARGGQPDKAARSGPSAPLGRAGQPEEIAAAIVWLISADASFVTGAIVDVTGGR